MRRPTRKSDGRQLSPSEMKRILVVDDDVAIRLAIETLLRKKGYRYSSAQSGEEATQLIDTNSYDLVITDLHMERRDTGLDVVRSAIAKNIRTSVLVITGYGNVENAVAAMKAGAIDFIEKPFSSIDELEATIEAALHRSRPAFLEAEKGAVGLDPFEGIIGDHPSIKEIFEVIQKLSDTDATVLLTGESGTGKELFARALHRSSQRSKGPFIPVNCCAIPEALLEAELFGSKKGSFTGAGQDRIGRFEAADKGTIFLDEIGDMPAYLQVKLLRVLQDHQIQPIGTNVPLQLNVRVLAATHRDLDEAVADGSFREDLYYRLNVIPIHIPPLRDRRDDILTIAHHFIERFNRETRRTISGMDRMSEAVLINYPWPGNIRELENTMERVVILKGSGLVEPADLPTKLTGNARVNYEPPPTPSAPRRMAAASPADPDPAGTVTITTAARTEPLPTTSDIPSLPAGGIDLRTFIQKVEYGLIDQALERTSGNRAKAARLLQMNRTTLVERLKKRPKDLSS